MRFLFVTFLAAILLVSCGHQSSKSPADDVSDSLSLTADSVDSVEVAAAEEVVPTAADELFDDFIFNFAANRKLQKSRIKFPLVEERDGKKSYIAANQWKMDYFFMRQDYYTLLFDNERQMETVKSTGIDHAVLEKIFFNDDAIKQYVFQREKGRWYMEKIAWQPLSASHNASFLNFYKRFATDADFQAESLNEVVQFVGPDPDDDFNMMEGVITADSWPAFAPQLPSKMIYNIIYGKPQYDQDDKVFVMRGIANGLEMQLRFHRGKGKWKLNKMTT